ncbi:hypothetical protein [Polymorphospora rubra]|uniref:hypothetical protein n=1 Tax=Polymorphospora rubra TaxID=338584 RepID=UPI0033D1DBF7
MSYDQELVIDADAHHLLAMVARHHGQTMEKALTSMIEAEAERVEPGLVEDMRRPGAAVNRFYAAMSRRVPVTFLDSEH